MMDGDFTAKETFFWGGLAAAIGGYWKYKTKLAEKFYDYKMARLAKKEGKKIEMEKKVIAKGPIGAIGSYEVAFEEGNLKASTEIHAVDLAIEGLKIAKEKIPGHFDDIAIDLAISKLEELKKP